MKPDSPTLHPTAEQWSAFLYGELAPDQRASCEQHLARCEDCRRQIELWRQTMAALEAWKLPFRHPSIPGARPLLRWAVAAVLLLGVGLLAGRLTVPRVDSAQLQAELRQQLRADLQTATAAVQADSDRKIEALAQTWAEARAQDQQTILALYQRVETQRKTDLAWLRRDVETLALNAEERLDTTQRNLTQLAVASQTFWDRPDAAVQRP